MRVLPGHVIAALCASALLFAGCERPDASHTTSPSARALLGVTEGTVALAPEEPLPAGDVAEGAWDIELGLARFTELENGTAALIVVATLKRTQSGAELELWLARDGKPIARWSGGSSRPYAGTLCFQLALEDEERGEALTLGPGVYTLTAAFRDPALGVVYAAQNPVTHQPPSVSGAAPGEGSPVFRTLLGCPRGS